MVSGLHALCFLDLCDVQTGSVMDLRYIAYLSKDGLAASGRQFHLDVKIPELGCKCREGDAMYQQ